MKRIFMLLLLSAFWLQLFAADTVTNTDSIQGIESAVLADSQEIQELTKKSTLVISTEPSEAIVLLDDSLKGLTPLSIGNVDTGVHVITLKKKGCYLKKIEIRIDSIAEQKLHFELQQPSSFCIITEPSGATLFINKKSVGESPYCNKLTRPGEYNISAEMTNHQKIELNHVIQSNVSDTLKMTLKYTTAYIDSVKASENKLQKRQKYLTRCIVGGAFLLFGLVLLSIETKE